MKICYLSDANSIHTKKMCRFFIDKGYDVSIISLNDGEIPGAKVYSMELKIDKNKSTIKKLNYLNQIRNIKKIIDDINPDIIHAHYASSYGLIGRFINRKPYILSVWGSDIYDFPKKSIIHKYIIKSNLKSADVLMSTSNVMKKETEKYTEKEILVTPFGVDTNKFKPFNNKRNDNCIVIGTIKSLEDKYGIDYLIKAFNIVKNKNPNKNIILKIAGVGSKLENYKKLVQELSLEKYVEFLGFIDQNEIIKRFNEFDIACFPSTLDSESFGVAAVEAQACGTSLIVSDVDGLKESTNPGVTSLMVRRKSVNDLAEKLELLIENSDLRKELSLNGRKYVLDNYDMNKNFSLIDNCYKEFMKGKN